MNLRRIANLIRNAIPLKEESANAKLLKAAKLKVQLKKEFLTHLFIFIPGAIALAIISIFFTPEEWWWFLIPLTAWSFLLGSHYIHAYGTPKWWYFGKDWENRELEKEFYKLKYEHDLENYLKNTKDFPLKEDKLELEELEEQEGPFDEEDYV